MEYSTGTRMSQLGSRQEERRTDAGDEGDAVDDSTTSVIREFLSSGFRVGLQYGVVDTVLLHLYAPALFVLTPCVWLSFG